MKIDTIVLDLIRKKVQKLVDEGSTKTYAVTTICNDMGLNPHIIMKKIYPSKSSTDIKYDDIKTSEGSYVVLKKNSNKQYEVININNKDSIIIRDLDDNSELKVKEEEILPIVMETMMNKKLNEANYNLSIDGLQTMDADTLSQILTLAGQAENGGDVVEEPMVSEIPTEMPMDGEMESPVSEFEPTLSADFDGPGFEAAEIDNMEDPMSVEDPDADVPAMDTEIEEPVDDFEEFGEYEQYPLGESKMDEDVLLDPKSDDETYNAHKDDEKEALEEAYNGNFETLRNEILNNEISSDEAIAALLDMGEASDDEEALDIINGIKEDAFFADEEDFEEFDEAEELTDGEELTETEDEMIEESDDFDAEIAECLRLAGIELNEVSDEDATKGKKDLPNVVGKKTAFSNAEKDGFKPGENQRPDYRCVKTKDVMGKKSTEGFARPMNIAEMVSKKKIESICETASRMYAKKDHSEWLALDRRYVEKLIKEGVSYSNASKMLLKAKKGN